MGGTGKRTRKRKLKTNTVSVIMVFWAYPYGAENQVEDGACLDERCGSPDDARSQNGPRKRDLPPPRDIAGRKNTPEDSEQRRHIKNSLQQGSCRPSCTGSEV